jgi:hypothetical protein
MNIEKIREHYEHAKANAWRKICADCQEGEPPKGCEYYGEPCGCNAPTMGKHPTCEKSSPVGNAAKMREALGAVIKVGYPHNFQREAPHIRGYCYDITKAIKKCFAALAAPPRNIDLFVSEDEAKFAFIAYYNDAFNLKGTFDEIDTWNLKHDVEGILHDYIEWLFAEAKGEAK